MLSAPVSSTLVTAKYVVTRAFTPVST